MNQEQEIMQACRTRMPVGSEDSWSPGGDGVVRDRRRARPQERDIRMDTKRKSIRRLTGCLRWAARIVGTAMLALIVLVGAGEIWSGQGLPNPFRQPPGVAAEVIAFIACLAGLILAWRWPRLGGLLLAAGVLTFHIVECKIWLNWVFLVLELVGAAHLCVWVLDRRYLVESRKD
jgi:hypothetical protein